MLVSVPIASLHVLNQIIEILGIALIWDFLFFCQKRAKTGCFHGNNSYIHQQHISNSTLWMTSIRIKVTSKQHRTGYHSLMLAR